MEDKTRLSEEQVAAALARLEGWTRDGKFIQKDFVFANFREINRFLPYLAQTIVAHNHHPDFAFVGAQKKVAVKVTTHSEGGLTRADVELAAARNDWRAATGG
jgi:4a-hydroxytetrahydrobiopterin dehydratase